MRPTFTIKTDSFDAIYERGLELIRFLNSVGVRVPPAGRHQRYVQQISRMVMNHPGGKHQKQFSLSEAHRGILEIGELAFIASELSRAPEVAGWRQLMRDAMGGESYPSRERAHSRSRDIQFEMYIASISLRWL